MTEFNPDWTLAPAAILREWLRENNLSPEVLAVACGGRSRKQEMLTHIRSVLDRKPMSEQTARLLSRGTMIPSHVWLALEKKYRSDLAAGRTDTTEDDS